MTEAQKRAKEKYQPKVRRFTVDFYPTETDLWEHLQNQPKKQTYIKDLIRADMKRKEQRQIYLIYRDDQNDYCEMKGYIYGTEKEAADYCASLNKNCKYWYQEYEYELILQINK